MTGSSQQQASALAQASAMEQQAHSVIPHLPQCMQQQMNEDIAKMLICECYLGSANLENKMARYVYSRRPDGIHLLNIKMTWEKLILAARVLASVPNASDICAISARPSGGRACLKFAHYTGTRAVAGRWTPGMLTNQITAKFCEPRAVVVCDPRFDLQAIKECSLANVIVIAFCNTDSPINNVDVAIPCNNKGFNSIGLMYWLLARELLYLRGDLPRSTPWEVAPELFFYKTDDHMTSAQGDQAVGEAQSEEEQNVEATAELGIDQQPLIMA